MLSQRIWTKSGIRIIILFIRPMYLTSIERRIAEIRNLKGDDHLSPCLLEIQKSNKHKQNMLQFNDFLYEASSLTN